MHNKRNLSTALICALLVIALAVVPMLTLTVFAEGEDDVKLYGPGGMLYTLDNGKLPEVAEIPEGYTFAGWSTTKIDADTTTEPTILKADTAVTSGTYYTVFTKTESEPKTETVYQKTDIADITATDVVVITMAAKSGTVWALANNKGTTAAPTAVVVTTSGTNITSEIADALLWNISASSGSYTFYPNGTTAKWLYCTSTNNGVRVGTNTSNAFTIDSASGYLKHTSTSRYVGVYTTNPDWRCYTNTTGNIAGQTLAFYVSSTTTTTVDTIYYYGGEICMHGNEVESAPENNQVTVSCEDCGAILGTKDYCAHEKQGNQAVTATAIHDGYKIVTCVDCGEELSNEILSATCTHSYDTVTLAGGGSASVCSNCGHTTDRKIGASGQSFTLDDSFTSGRFYIAAIRTSGNYWYMTNSLGTASTERYQAVDSGSTTLPEIITNPDSSKVFVVERNSDGTYKIYAEGISGDEKYLYHASGNSGTFSDKDNAPNFTITANNGAFNIYHSDNSRYLEINKSTGNNYFAFYGGTQIKDLSLIPVGSQHPSFTGTQAQLGEDLAAKFGVKIPDGIDTDKLSLKITSGHGNVSTVDSIATEGDVSYFLYDGIAPQCIGDSIKAELCYDGQTVDVYGYSFTEYLREAWLENPGEELAQLITDLLAYGKAAQEYTGHEITVTDEDIASYGAVNRYAPTEDDNVRAIAGNKESAVKYKGVGVRFDVVNSIYVVISGATSDTTVKVGNKTYTANAEGEVKIYLDAISVLDFGTAVTIELCESDEVIQTLTYSINSYCYSMINGNKSDEMKALALALYNYGISAANYAN